MHSVENYDYGPLRLIIIQPTSLCNLNCSYCYISEDARKTNRIFPLENVTPVFSKIFKSPVASEDHDIEILWHEGEPLLQPIEYYETFIASVNQCIEESGKKLSIQYSVQTNGTLINSDWCEFFNKHNIKVGLSLDGPEFIHDQYRVRWNKTGSFNDTESARLLMDEHGVSMGVLSTITPETLKHPDAFFDFMKSRTRNIGLNFIEQNGAQKDNHFSDFYQECDHFISRLFDRYLDYRLENPDDYLCIREFDYLTSYLLSTGAFRADSGYNIPFQIISVTSEGNFSTFSPELSTYKTSPYADNNFYVGNLLTDSIEDAINSHKFQQIYQDVRTGQDMCQNACEYFDVCRGTAPSVKYSEHGTFCSTETSDCIIRIKMIANIILKNLDERLKDERLKIEQLDLAAIQAGEQRLSA